VSQLKYRSRTDIISEILKIAQGGSSKTKIMYGAYLSYDQLKDYMSTLTQNGLLERKGTKYTTTKKGSDFVRSCEHIGKMLGPIGTKSDQSRARTFDSTTD